MMKSFTYGYVTASFCRKATNCGAAAREAVSARARRGVTARTTRIPCASATGSSRSRNVFSTISSGRFASQRTTIRFSVIPMSASVL